MRSSTLIVHGDTVQVVLTTAPVGASTEAIMWSAEPRENRTCTVRGNDGAKPPMIAAGNEALFPKANGW